MLAQTGYAGQTVTLDVEDDGRIVGSQPVPLPADGDPALGARAVHRDRSRAARFRFRVAPQPNEVVAQNNERESMIDMRDRKERILYFEGEPRLEMKFLRQAVQGRRTSKW